MSGTTGAVAPPSVVVTASIAYDYIMTFPGSFADHIIPEKAHVLSVSFLVDSLRRQRGGVGGNIAYNLALLGTPAALVGAVGADFGAYREEVADLPIDLSHVRVVEDEATASAFVMSDLRDNQIVAFYPGASMQAAGLSVCEIATTARYGLVGADAPEAMRRHAREVAEAGCRLIYDPSQQVVALPPADLVAGIEQAWAVIGNDYELAMIEQKTGLSVDDVAERVDLLVVTFGEEGSELRQGGRRVRVPSAPARELRDPTGAGDAYRAGLIKGLLLERELEVTGRLAGLAATYAVERHGTQEHRYAPEEFALRFDEAFPTFAGAIAPEDLRLPTAGATP